MKKYFILLFTLFLGWSSVIRAQQLSVSVIDLSNALTVDGNACLLYSSSTPLDFTSVEGIKAYTAQRIVSQDSYGDPKLDEILLTPVQRVPAGTGIFLKAEEARTYNVPVATGDIEPLENNELIAVSERTDAANFFNVTLTSVNVPATLALINGSIAFTIDFPSTTGSYLSYEYSFGEKFIESNSAYLPLGDEAEEYLFYSLYGNEIVLPITFGDGDFTTVDNIAAFKEKATGSTVQLLLDNAQVNVVSDKLVGIQDATGGLFLQISGFPVKPGQQLSGSISGRYSNVDMLPALQAVATTTTENLIVSEGTRNITEATLKEACSSAFEGILIDVTDVSVRNQPSQYGSGDILVSQGNEEVTIFDYFNVLTTLPEDGTTYPHFIAIPVNMLFVGWVLVPVPEQQEEPATTEATIDMSDALTVVQYGNDYYRFFSSTQALDFTLVEGLTAYVAKKLTTVNRYDEEECSEVLLTPVERVPAETGLLIKASEGILYNIPLATEAVSPVENDLQANLEKKDFADIAYFNDNSYYFTNIPFAVLQVQNGQLVLTADLPDQKGSEYVTGQVFLPAASAYIALNDEEFSNMSWNGISSLGLAFSDASIPEVEDIAAFRALSDGTLASLKLNDAVVNYASEEYIALEDASGAILLKDFDLQLQAGQRLTGTLVGTLQDAGFYHILQSSVLSDPSSVIPSAEVAPLSPRDVTLSEALLPANDLRLVRLSDLVAEVEYGTYGNDIHFLQGDEEITLFDNFGVAGHLDIQSGDHITSIVGLPIVYSINLLGSVISGKAIIPVSADGIANGLNSLHEQSAPHDVYSLEGLRLSGQPRKPGIYILGQRKVVVQ